jgi:hypothetical protein
VIDNERKRARDWCDKKKSEALQPVTDWQAEEDKKVARLLRVTIPDEAISDNAQHDREVAKKLDLERRETAMAEKEQAAQAKQDEEDRLEHEARIKDEAAKEAIRAADQKIKADAFAKSEAAFKPLRDALAAGNARVAKAKADLTAKTTAYQQSEKVRNDAKVKLDASNAALLATTNKTNLIKSAVAKAQGEEKTGHAALVAKQAESSTTKTQLAAAQAAHTKAEASLAALVKQKEGVAAKVAAVVKKDTDTKKSVELAKVELENTKFLKQKWQAAAINLTARQESEELDDMKFDLEDMKEGEVVAKQEVTDATKARTEAESALASAKKTVVDGTMQLKEKSSTVLERALKLVASRAVAELREEALLSQDSLTLASNTESASPFRDTIEDGMEEEEEKIEIVAAQTLSYKTPDEINAEVDNLKMRLVELEQFLATTYQEADKTKTTVDQASKVARETPKLIAERTEAEKQAAKELSDAEAERKRQETVLVEQAKKIDELKKKYLATFPKRD